MTTSPRDIADRIALLERNVRDLQRAPRLANASIEGFPLTVNDEDGQLRQTVGLQPDGTYTTTDVNGPPPPSPSLPGVEARPGTLVVTSDGTFAAGAAAPADWDHTEVHVSPTSGYTPTDETQVATFNTLKGGSVTLALDPVPQYVVLVAVSTSRTESTPTVEVIGTPLPAATDGGVKTYYEDTPPLGLDADDDGSLWFDTNDSNHPYRWDGPTLQWLTVRDGTIAAASAAAAAAQTQANGALTAAQAAQATADGSIRTFYQSSAPWANGSSQPPEVVGDLWFDTDDGQAYRWSGTTWVIIEDNSIAAALAAAQNAQTTADGKITSYYQTTIPTIGEVGDLWYDTDDQNKTYYCSSVTPLTWTSIRDGTIAVAQSAADAAQSTANAADLNAAAAASAAASAAADAIAALDKFPVTETDITDGAISTPKLAAGAIDGIVITGALIRTAAAGRRVEQTVAGFVVYEADDTPLVLFPTDSDLDPSFAGNVQAKQLAVQEGATLGGDSEMSPGSSLRLRSGVGAPKSAPVVTIDWPSIPWALSRYGLQSDSTNWLTILDGVVPSVDTYSKATGSLTSSLPLPGFGSNGIRPWGGCVKIGTEYFMLSYVVSTGAYLIHKVNSSGNALINAVYTPLAGVNGSGGSVSQAIAPASIGTDGTNILIGEYDSANAKYRIQTRSTTTLAVTATLNTNFSGGGPVVGIMGGSSFDFGATRFVIATRTNGIRTYDAAGALQSSEIIPAPATDATGVGWDGSNFHTAARNGGSPRVFKHTAQRYGATPLYAAYTWNDTVGADETPMGPAAVFTPPSRSRVTLTAGAIPNQADSVRFYIGTSATRTDQWQQVTPSVGVITKSYETILTTGANPPAVNGFPITAPPAEVVYEDGSVAISADGTLRGVAIDMDLSSATNTFPGLISVDPSSWIQTGWGDLDSTNYGPSRAWYDPVRKWIEVEIYLQRTGANTATNTIHSPVVVASAYRPQYRVNLVVPASVGGTEVMARLTMLRAGEANAGRMDAVFATTRVWTTGQFAMIKGGWKVP